MARYAKIFIIGVILVFLASLAVCGYDKVAIDKAGSDSVLYEQLKYFGEAINILRTEYVEPVDSKKLVHGAMRGMLSGLDDYSQFLEKEEFEELESDAKGEFGGLGLEIAMKGGMLTVITPIDGSPAEKSDIKPGDRIVKIDGKATEAMGISEAVKMMRGEPGTTATLSIWREKSDKVFDASIRRAVIKVKSIKSAELIDGKIGYIKLVEFQENTPRDLDIALKKLESQGLVALVLDLRNNPGGLLDAAAAVCERFLPEGAVVVSIKTRDPKNDTVYKSGGKFAHTNFPIMILVNGGSASAAEVFAGAMQDNNRAVIIGTRTFGKASVQTVEGLENGTALRFTSAYYYTPKGRLIKKEGIVPDVVIDRNGSVMEKSVKTPTETSGKTDDEDILSRDKDEQLKMAIGLLKALKVYGEK